MFTHIGTHRVEHTDTGSGPVLLALHGGMGGYDQSWLLARALLADVASHRVIAVSRPGYLRTPLAAGETAEEQADLFARLLDSLRIERATVAAVSAGGLPALQFATRHADRCQRLVLVSAVTGRLEANPEIQRRMRLIACIARVPGLTWLLRRRMMRDPRAAISRSVRDPEVRERTLSDPDASALLQEVHLSVMRDLPQRLAGTLNDTARLSRLEDLSFAGVRVPVLAIHGTADAVVPFAHAERLAASSPAVRLCALNGGEHVALFTHLAMVRKAVAEFERFPDSRS
jgi:pimeloyl-ACP methyl ester carboxylesterase